MLDRLAGVAGGLGKVALAATKGAYEVGKGVGETLTTEAVGASRVVGKTLFKSSDEYDNLMKTKLTGAGKIAFTGYALGASAVGAVETYDELRLGTPSGMISNVPTSQDYQYEMSQMQSRTPKASSYGAGGDLVFAMNANRRG